MFRLIRISLKDIYRKPFKTIIFSLLVSIGIGTLILALSMNKSINYSVENNIINILLNRKLYIEVDNPGEKTYEQYLSYLKAIPHVEDVYKFVPNIGARIDNDSLLSRASYVMDSGPSKYIPRVIKGSNFSESDHNAVILPEKLFVQSFGYGPDDEIDTSDLTGKTITISYGNQDGASENKYECKVIGVYKNQPGDNSNKIYIPLDDMYRISAQIGFSNSKKAFMYTAIVDKQEFVDGIIKGLSDKKGNTISLYDTSISGLVGTYKTLTKITGIMIYCIIAFIILMLYICVTNIVMSNRKQVALYKALGYNNRHIFNIVFSEAVFISLIGCFLGIIIAITSNNFLINPLISAKTNLVLFVSISFLSCVIPLIPIIPIAFMVSSLSYFKVKKIYPAILLNQD